MKANQIMPTVLFIICSPLVSGPALAQCEPGVCWTRVNNGNYIDAGEPLADESSWYSPIRYFTSFKTNSGDLMYFFSSKHIGKAVGRLTPSGRWELWSQDSWSNEQDVVATAIDHVMGDYSKLSVYDHPDCPDALLGVGTTFLSLAQLEIDTHGNYYNFVFDTTGACFAPGPSQWRHTTIYHPLHAYGLIKTWSGPRRDQGGPGDFAYDAASRRGILVGTVGFFYLGVDRGNRLTATLYDHDNLSQRWRRWHQPSTADDDPPINCG